PCQNSFIAAEVQNDFLNILQGALELFRVAQDIRSRALDPSRVVNTRPRRLLRSGLGKRIPNGIEQHQNRADMVFVAELQKRIDAMLEGAGILVPRKIVQENAERV